jgi:hypothetical protein
MVAGISGATPGSGGAAEGEDNDGRLMLPHAPRNIVSADAIPRWATVRALHDLTMASPEQNSWPLPSRSQAQNFCRSNDAQQLRRRSDLVSFKASYIGLTKGLTPLLDRISVKPYSRAHN